MEHHFYSRKRNTYIYMSARQTFMQAYFFLIFIFKILPHKLQPQISILFLEYKISIDSLQPNYKWKNNSRIRITNQIYPGRRYRNNFMR
jgi:hypothetical protein